VEAIPVAFVSIRAAVVVWLLVIPAGILLNRRAPREIADWY
jgi:hypothetical protein